MSAETDTPLGWDSSISEDSGGFEALPDNTTVEFEVKALEKTRTADGKKPMARIQIVATAVDGSGRTSFKEQLVLSTNCAWKIGAFFVSIGHRKHGEAIVPNWDAVVGARGRAVLGQRHWKGRDGDDMVSNEIKTFLEPVDAPEEMLDPDVAFG